MKNIGFVVLISAFVGFISAPVKAQNAQQGKAVVYEITIMGLTCDADAKKLDQFFMGRKGVVSSSTDFSTKRLKVIVDPVISLSAIRDVIVRAGFEMSEENLFQSEQ